MAGEIDKTIAEERFTAIREANTANWCRRLGDIRGRLCQVRQELDALEGMVYEPEQYFNYDDSDEDIYQEIVDQLRSLRVTVTWLSHEIL